MTPVTPGGPQYATGLGDEIPDTPTVVDSDLVAVVVSLGYQPYFTQDMSMIYTDFHLCVADVIFAARARSKIVRFDDAVQLAPVDGGTRLDAQMTAEPQGLMRVVGPLMGRTMRKQFASNWDHLRRALER